MDSSSIIKSELGAAETVSMFHSLNRRAEALELKLSITGTTFRLEDKEGHYLIAVGHLEILKLYLDGFGACVQLEANDRERLVDLVMAKAATEPMHVKGLIPKDPTLLSPNGTKLFNDSMDINALIQPGNLIGSGEDYVKKKLSLFND